MYLLSSVIQSSGFQLCLARMQQVKLEVITRDTVADKSLQEAHQLVGRAQRRTTKIRPKAIRGGIFQLR